MSKTVREVARAFAQGKPARCGNAHTDGTSYWLHGNRIAHKYNAFNLESQPRVEFNWCGWYTPTTANHINECLDALTDTVTRGVSYAQARDTGATTFVLNLVRNTLADSIEEVAA